LEKPVEPEAELEQRGSTVIKAIINVTGYFEPADFTHKVSLSPTETVRAGDPRSPLLKFNEDAWRINLGERDSLSIEEEVDRILMTLEPICDSFREAVRIMGLNAEAAFIVFTEEGISPAISLRVDQIRKLSELGMSLDIDIM
jgi:hypothetical protein